MSTKTAQELKEEVKDVELPVELQVRGRESRPYAKEFYERFPVLEGPVVPNEHVNIMTEARKGMRKEMEKLQRFRDQMKERWEARHATETDEVVEEEEPEQDESAEIFGEGYRTSIGRVQSFTNSKFLDEVVPEGLTGTLQRELTEQGCLGLVMRPEVYNVIEYLKTLDKSFFTHSQSILGEPSDSNSVVLGGEAGFGRSVMLLQIVLWARANGWLTVFIPNAYDMVSDGIIYPSRCMPGLWDQPEVASNFCLKLLEAHEDKFSNIPLRGEYDMLGFEQGDDTTLADLLRFGSESFRYAVDSVLNFKEELSRVVEYPVLVAIDSINAFDYTSGFGNPNAERFTGELMPARNLSLTEIFYHHKQPGLVRGTCVGAVSGTIPEAEFYAQHGKDHVLEVPPYALEHFSKVMEYYNGENWTIAKTPRETIRYLHAVTAGIPRELHTYMKHL